MKRLITKAYLPLIFSIVVYPSAHASEGGYSNYIPGTYGDFAAAVEPPTKLTVRNDLYHYSADGDESVRSGLLELGVEIDFNINLTTVLYKPDVKLWGASYAFGALVPIVNADIDSQISLGPLQVRLEEEVTRLGDVTLIPGVLFWQRGNFHITAAEYIIAPTGDYDSNELVNPGLNYFSFDTNFAATYLNEQTGQDYSVNIGHIYNTENDDTNYQSGQEIHVDFMINQYLSDAFGIGIHGFYLKQITGDSGDGAVLGDFKAEAAGVGPAVIWNTQVFGKPVSFIAKWLHEYHAERRLEGDHLFVSFALSF
jgi:hypothetical protein